MRRLSGSLGVWRVKIAWVVPTAVASCADYTCQDTASCVFEEADGGTTIGDRPTPGLAISGNSTWDFPRENTGEADEAPTPLCASHDAAAAITYDWANVTSQHQPTLTVADGGAATGSVPDAGVSLASTTPTEIDEESLGASLSTAWDASSAVQCANGVREANEECDDGNADDADGCRGCVVAFGWRCIGEVGAGSECADIDECSEGVDTCDVNAFCSDIDGGFECACNDGYSGSGQSCHNVNECDDTALNDCHAEATCTDTVGSFTCECRPGFDGDGSTCVEEAHVTKLAISNQMCALIDDGRVFCWAGWALGNGPNDNSYQPIPTEVYGITSAIDVSVGGNTVCVLLENKTVKCWGADDLGQASGTGTSSEGVYTPTAVSGLSNVTSVSNTNWTTCVLLANGTVRCFGSSNGSGGSPTATRTMTSLSTTTRLSAPTHEELCAVDAYGITACWAGAAATPSAVSGLSGVSQVAGRCALLTGGSVKCWGPGGSGQIGNGSNDDQATPQLVQRLGTATHLAAGRNHACALLEDHSVSCWGKDGFFSAIDYGNLPLPISGLGEVVAVYAGGDSSCAVEVDNTVKCWGSNLGGQLGEDREGNEFAPVVIHGLPGSE